jgi:hypothetical protein
VVTNGDLAGFYETTVEIAQSPTTSIRDGFSDRQAGDHQRAWMVDLTDAELAVVGAETIHTYAQAIDAMVSVCNVVTINAPPHPETEDLSMGR